MKKTPLRKVGPIGKANIEANKRIREQNPVRHCEVKLKDCLGGIFLTIAHRHKRVWYKGNPARLADPKEWIVACVKCHNAIEHNKELTKKVFEMLKKEPVDNSTLFAVLHSVLLWYTSCLTECFSAILDIKQKRIIYG